VHLWLKKFTIPVAFITKASMKDHLVNIQYCELEKSRILTECWQAGRNQVPVLAIATMSIN
jgi:hypothetical protein